MIYLHFLNIKEADLANSSSYFVSLDVQLSIQFCYFDRGFWTQTSSDSVSHSGSKNMFIMSVSYGNVTV